jgi:hypothetical protein
MPAPFDGIEKPEALKGGFQGYWSGRIIGKSIGLFMPYIRKQCPLLQVQFKIEKLNRSIPSFSII